MSNFDNRDDQESPYIYDEEKSPRATKKSRAVSAIVLTISLALAGTIGAQAVVGAVSSAGDQAAPVNAPAPAAPADPVPDVNAPTDPIPGANDGNLVAVPPHVFGGKYDSDDDDDGTPDERDEDHEDYEDEDPEEYSDEDGTEDDDR